MKISTGMRKIFISFPREPRSRGAVLGSLVLEAGLREVLVRFAGRAVRTMEINVIRDTSLEIYKLRRVRTLIGNIN
jgi:hypothetical protein